MILAGRDKLEAFGEKYPAAEKPLKAWRKLMEENEFKHLPELKSVFGSADYDKPDTIFDIGGNKFRLVALVNYAAKTVLVKAVLTHAEYDKRGKRK